MIVPEPLAKLEKFEVFGTVSVCPLDASEKVMVVTELTDSFPKSVTSPVVTFSVLPLMVKAPGVD